MEITDTDRLEFFDYLEILRENGSVNMYGAAPYLAREYNLDLHEAREILIEWIYSHRK